MPSSTTYGYPYPIATDHVADNAAKVQELAQAVDDQLGQMKRGSVNSGVLVAATAKAVAVVFPVAFPAGGAVPTVVASFESTLGGINIFLGVSAVTRAGFTLNFRRDTGTAALDAQWIALAQ